MLYEVLIVGAAVIVLLIGVVVLFGAFVWWVAGE